MKTSSRARLTRLSLGLCLAGAGLLASPVAFGAKTDDEFTKKDVPELRFDFSMFGGYHWFNDTHALGRSKDNPDTAISPKNGLAFGGRLGLHFNKWVGIEFEAGAVPSRTRGQVLLDPETGEVDDSKMWVFGYRGSVLVNLSDSYYFQPFLLAGYGGLTSLVDNTNVVSNSTWGFLHAGGGFKIGFTPWTGIRVDGRVMGPWTVLSPPIPKGDRPDFKGPDFEILGSFFVNFGEIEKSQVVQKIISAPKPGDKDGDGFADDVDRCPADPEDKDGFQDQDGCPDLDNDNDGIQDPLDKCPSEAEDKDGFQDDDGCPDPDNDGDGVADALDKCPNQAEDKDGFQDEDGCSEPDNDNDGLADAIDKCPNQPETMNKYKDDDGCPDEVPPEVKKFTGVIEGINFKTGSAEILPGSFVILDRAVKVLTDFPDVNLEISGHTDNRGRPDYNRDLSQRRADSVKMYFTSRGVSHSRLQSIGYGPNRPIADNKSANGRATNRRTEFRLIDSGEMPR